MHGATVAVDINDLTRFTITITGTSKFRTVPPTKCMGALNNESYV